MAGHWDATSARSEALVVVDAPDPSDDALVDLTDAVVDAAAHAAVEEKGARSQPPRRALGASDLAPGTTHRKLVEAALPFELEARDGALRPPEWLPRSGIANPLACFAECGDPQCACAASAREFLVGRGED